MNNIDNKNFNEIIKDYMNEIEGKIKRTSKEGDFYKENFYILVKNLLEKYSITRQFKGLEKVKFSEKIVDIEHNIKTLGINNYTYIDEVNDIIERAAFKPCLVLLEEYEDELPDESVELVKLFRFKFDEIYILYSENNYKDISIFGRNTNDVIQDRLYIIDYKTNNNTMINYFSKQKKNGLIRAIKTIVTSNDLKEMLSELTKENDMYRSNKKKNTGIRSMLNNILAKVS